VPVVPTCEAVPDEIPLCIPRGGQVLVIGGLRLAPGGTDISREIARTIAPAIEAFRGPEWSSSTATPSTFCATVARTLIPRSRRIPGCRRIVDLHDGPNAAS